MSVFKCLITISLVWILLFLTNCLLISVWVHLKSTNTFTLSSFLFFVFMSACTFNSLLELLHWFGIIYLFWEFIWEISCTMPTWDLHQNPVLFCLHCQILLEPFVSSLITFLCNPWLCALSCYIWNIFLFCVLSSSIGIHLPCVYICCN